MAFSWRCPFCGHVATIRDDDVCRDNTTLYIKNSIGQVTLSSSFIVCPNEQCKKFTLDLHLWRSQLRQGSVELVGGDPWRSWKLIPPSDAKILPSYVPQAIVSDYLEACAIKSLSPKASATLARRCLQGMIRDFWGIKKGRLIDEVEALEAHVDSTTWGAIDALRKVGNIGAHMEKDINTIVEVEPEEAGLLINLIETLVDDWYVARYERQQRMSKVIALGQAKQNQKQGPAATT